MCVQKCEAQLRVFLAAGDDKGISVSDLLFLQVMSQHVQAAPTVACCLAAACQICLQGIRSFRGLLMEEFMHA